MCWKWRVSAISHTDYSWTVNGEKRYRSSTSLNIKYKFLSGCRGDPLLIGAMCSKTAECASVLNGQNGEKKGGVLRTRRFSKWADSEECRAFLGSTEGVVIFLSRTIWRTPSAYVIVEVVLVALGLVSLFSSYVYIQTVLLTIFDFSFLSTRSLFLLRKFDQK